MAALEESVKMVADGYGAYARGCAGEDEVAGTQGDEAREVGDKLVNVENHVGGVALLHKAAVEQEGEVEVADGLAEFLQGYERTDDGTPIKAFGKEPGHTRGFGLPLEVAGGEVDAESCGTIVFAGKAGLDALAEAVDADNHFDFVLDVGGEIGVEERQLFGVERAVGLFEKDGFGGDGGVHLAGMGGIVAYNAEDFHGGAKVFGEFYFLDVNCGW